VGRRPPRLNYSVGDVYRLAMDDGPLVTVLGNHTWERSDPHKRGAYAMSDQGDTIHKRTVSVNAATQKRLIAAVAASACVTV